MNFVRNKTLGVVLALIAAAAMLVIAVPPAHAQSEPVLYTFQDDPDGAYPQSNLVADSSGNLYGTTNAGGIYGYGTVFKLTPCSGSGNGWCETILHSFCRACADGTSPSYASLIFDNSGNLYGTTSLGGANSEGTVFEINSGGCCETVIYSFCALANCADGSYPGGGLVWDSSGNLYGTESGGVFELSNTTGGWTSRVIYTDQYLSGGLAIDASGNIYGNDSSPDGEYRVFKLSVIGGTWKPTIIHIFAGQPDEQTPVGPPVVDSAGNVYGTNYSGGTLGDGTVWKLLPVSTQDGLKYSEQTLHVFSSALGTSPSAGVTLDSFGNIYGTASQGGKFGNYGSVFELVANGSTYEYRILWMFDNVDGNGPMANLILDSSGNLYGTTEYGGPIGVGTVFEVNPAGVATKTALTSSPDPSTSGETVTFSATVSSTNGAPPDGEPVNFMNGTTLLGTGSLSGGTAIFITSSLPVGSSKVDAVYDGDVNFRGSTSKTLNQVVEQ